MKKIKGSKVLLAILLMVVVTISSVVVVPPIRVSAATPKALTKKDFVYTYKENGKKKTIDTYAVLQKDVKADSDTGYYMAFYRIDESESESVKKTDFTTNRGIRLGSRYSDVVNKYGKAKKNKYRQKDGFSRWIAYDANTYVKNLSYYVVYDLKNTKYSIVFFFDKSNEVIDVFYLYDIECFDTEIWEKTKMNYFNSQTQKKISKSYYKGKTIFEIPKDAIFKPDKKEIKSIAVEEYRIYDKNGNLIALSGAESSVGKTVYEDLIQKRVWVTDYSYETSISKDKIKKYLKNPDKYCYIVAYTLEEDRNGLIGQTFYRFKLK